MKYLGIDWGLKKIGLAISDGEIASPLTTLEVKSLGEAVDKVNKIAKKEIVDQIIIGKPGGEMGKKVEVVVKLLSREGFSIIMADETLSTQQAQKLMVEMGFSKKARGNDNAIAAAIILQRYLDEQT